MGRTRDYLDIVGGIRDGIRDEPPWWAATAILAFAALLVVVLAINLVLGLLNPGDPQPRRGHTTNTAAATPPAPASSTPITTAPANTATAAETFALADRNGTLHQIPGAAITAARAAGAPLVGARPEEVQHELVDVAAPDLIELEISNPAGTATVTVTAFWAESNWQAAP